MSRMSNRAYELKVGIAMSIYMLLLVLVWPLSREDGVIWLKAIYALVPVVPVTYVIWLLAQRIVRSDEFEQRMHLIGLGVSSAVVAVATLIAAFLALARLFTVDWAAIALMWVFPLQMLVYSFVRSYAARRYGGGDECDDGTRRPMVVRFLLIGITVCLIAAYARYRSHNEQMSSMALGMACGMGAVGLAFWIRQRLRKRKP